MTQANRPAVEAIVAVISFGAMAAAAHAQVPRTPDGHPDLQGIWDFRTITPLERPSQFAGKDVLTPDEPAALEQRTAETRVDRAPRTGDPGTYNQFWFDFGTRVVDDKPVPCESEHSPGGSGRVMAAAEIAKRARSVHRVLRPGPELCAFLPSS